MEIYNVYTGTNPTNPNDCDIMAINAECVADIGGESYDPADFFLPSQSVIEQLGDIEIDGSASCYVPESFSLK